MERKKKFPEEYEETPWIYPLMNRGEIDIMDLSAEVAKNTGLDEEKIKDTMRLYLKMLHELLKEGNSVEFLQMGYLHPKLDENGELIAVNFRASKEFQEKLKKRMRSNPSLN